MPSDLDHSKIRLRRSVLSVPAVNRRALDKVPDLDSDAVIFDLEDSVAPEKKSEARDNLRQLFSTRPAFSRERIIRINARDTGFFEEDVAAVLECRPDAILVPKVNCAEDVLAVSEALNRTGASHAIDIWAMMETPLSILNAAEIARVGRTHPDADIRLTALVVGLNDLRKDTDVLPDPDRTYLVPWLMQVVLAARAYGIHVLDSVSNDFRDLDTFARECAQGRAMGFDGKMLIHPAQIEASNCHFGPSDLEIEDARVVVAAFADPQTNDLNVINSNGRMIERLHLDQARQILARLAVIEDRKDKTS